MYYDLFADVIGEIYGKDPGAHDVGHATRVARMSLKLGMTEGGDPTVLEIAGLLHDIHRIRQDIVGRPVEPKDTLDEVMEIIELLNKRIAKLIESGAPAPAIVSDTQIQTICTAIEHHEHYKWNGELEELPIEAYILQDADNLDAIGGVGIGRSCAYHGAHSSPIYNGEPVNFDKDPDYVENILVNKSGLHHFADVLLHLNESMNTETARKIADRRVARMRMFCDWYLEEWFGEDM